MTDFIDSFNRGLAAAVQAGKNKQEIRSVLEALSEQLSQASDGKLEISVYNKQLPFAFLASGEQKVEYQFLAAVNPLATSKSPTELAKWKLDAHGYPCHITTSESELFCEDKAALERALKELISNPAVGEKLYAVMKQKLKDAQEE